MHVALADRVCDRQRHRYHHAFEGANTRQDVLRSLMIFAIDV
jgi:hypothetical protein